ncbi:hypothetical protein ACYPKM_05205 [Pseudomonas aeruginosa]
MTQPHQDDLNQLKSTIQGARTVFEQMLNGSELESTNGSCLYAAIFCRTVLHQFTNWRATIRGGGDGVAGILVDGKWEGHYWVEATLGCHMVIVDISADQFGFPTVVVATPDKAPTTYKAGDQAVVDRSVIEEERLISQSYAA